MEPIHLAIIPDGNRRWAKGNMLLPWQGHAHAMDNFRAITEWCRNDPRINVLTIWGFSTENWKRSDDEVSKLMELFEDYLGKERHAFAEHKTRFVHSGRRDRIPASLKKLIDEVEAETKDFTEFTMHLAVDYGGKDEVLRAIAKMKGEEMTDDSLRAHLDHPELPDIDFIIRTSGEQRTSNFFFWQACYAEWLFVTKHFPALEVADIDAALQEFNRRTRRFGGG